ncbi:MAG: ferrochelatase [Mariprofundales bacterium]
MQYTATPFDHKQTAKVGVLLTNLGTPDAPTAAALRRYLAEFLTDERVVELPRWQWLPILHGIVLRTRPKRSAAAYARVWDADGENTGSPLLHCAKQQCAALQEKYSQTLLCWEIGMRYGNPSIATALQSLRAQKCTRILIMPLYPQYSASTTASTMDAVMNELKLWRWQPELRTINSYYDHPSYISALTDSVVKYWQQYGNPIRLLFSFHGLPKRYVESGDPYACHCRKTARLIADKLELSEENWTITFQSRFGREEWIKPYTDETLQKWGAEGLSNVHVLCPGFSCDCLETLEEIAIENKHLFTQAGGGDFHYIPALNASDTHIQALHDILHEHLIGWI